MGHALDPSEDYFEKDGRFMAMADFLLSLPAGKLCDLGCGRGALLRRLSHHHAVCGTDYDPAVVSFCRQAGLDVHEIDLNDATELPFTDAKFDVIVISEVCEHLLAPRNALRVIKRALQPGGLLVLTVPNAVPLFSRLRLLLGQTVDWLHYPSQDTETTGHIRFYTIASMSRLLREEGYSVKEAKGVSFRMNGLFWGRFCYWLPRLFLDRRPTTPVRLDIQLGRMFPGMSPGLMFVCQLLPVERA